MTYEERQAVKDVRQARAVAALERQANALERCAKALEDLYRNVEMSTEPENLHHPGDATVFKVRRYE